MDFRLAEHGQVFATRPRGLDIRKQVESHLAPDEMVAVSFDSVLKVSQSFSDEFFCALVADLGPERVCVVGEPSPSVARVLNRALRRRGFADLEKFTAALLV